jgi:aryl-alcohol dehydrogenase-like predicted oxidoreductase
MKTSQLGSIGPVSRLTIGGGGIGQVWGKTTRSEAAATLGMAIENGINLIDVAPAYGRGEAERVVAEVFDGQIPPGVKITTKCQLGNPSTKDVESILRKSLQRSLETMALDRVDLYLLHSYIIPDGFQLDMAPDIQARVATSWTTYTEAVIPAFEQLIFEGLIGNWGITGVGLPSSIIDSMGLPRKPAVVQCITNLLDSPGAIRRYREDPQPRLIIQTAKTHNIGVLGIRAVQAGALTKAIDRDLPADHPDQADFRAAEDFRRLAEELDVDPAILAHQYALSIPHVDSVILGVKNREELKQCLAAERHSPLDAELIRQIEACVP